MSAVFDYFVLFCAIISCLCLVVCCVFWVFLSCQTEQWMLSCFRDFVCLLFFIQCVVLLCRTVEIGDKGASEREFSANKGASNKNMVCLLAFFVVLFVFCCWLCFLFVFALVCLFYGCVFSWMRLKHFASN